MDVNNARYGENATLLVDPEAAAAAAGPGFGQADEVTSSNNKRRMLRNGGIAVLAVLGVFAVLEKGAGLDVRSSFQRMGTQIATGPSAAVSDIFKYYFVTNIYHECCNGGCSGNVTTTVQGASPSSSSSSSSSSDEGGEPEKPAPEVLTITSSPTAAPVAAPTDAPIPVPTASPTASPTISASPSMSPTPRPTSFRGQIPFYDLRWRTGDEVGFTKLHDLYADAVTTAGEIDFLPGNPECSGACDLASFRLQNTNDTRVKYVSFLDTLENGSPTLQFEGRVPRGVDSCCDAYSQVGGVLYTGAYNFKKGDAIQFKYSAEFKIDWYEAVIALYAGQPPLEGGEKPVVARAVRGAGEIADGIVEVFDTTTLANVESGKYFLAFFLASFDKTGGRWTGAKMTVTGFGGCPNGVCPTI